jgi:hypothetical protein
MSGFSGRPKDRLNHPVGGSTFDQIVDNGNGNGLGLDFEF